MQRCSSASSAELPWTIAGYVDPRDVGPVLGVPHVGGDDVLPALLARHPGCAAAMGIGKVDATAHRARIQAAAEALGHKFPVFVSPDAVVNREVELGAGTASSTGRSSTRVLSPGPPASSTPTPPWSTTVAAARTPHRPGATVSGGVRIGDHTFVGAGAVVVQAYGSWPGA